MGLFSKIKAGLVKTKTALANKLRYVFSKNELDDEFFEELEYILISSDIDTESVETIIEEMKDRCKAELTKNSERAKEILKEILIDALTENEKPDFEFPLVVMVLGVNGVGKTTTIGKLTKYFKSLHKSVTIVAGDTFRAAASDQLSVWAERNKTRIIKSEEGTDAASVVFDGIKSAKANKTDVLIIDTAGRLHNKVNLMEELKKISKIINREWEGDYKNYLVIDATTGQNALSQVETFNECVGIDGIVLTKLDGTAKGGIVFAIAKQYGIPVKFVGVGEGLEDIVDFDAEEFVNGII